MENLIRNKDDAREEFLKNPILNRYISVCCEECGTIEEAKLARLLNGNRHRITSQKEKILCYKCLRKEAAKTIRKRMLEKYGVENSFQLETVKEKMKKTCLEKYGVEFSSQSQNNKIKTAKAWKNKSDEERKNIAKKIKESYTEEKRKLAEEKRKKTCLEKYGTETPFLYGSKEFRELMKERYGVEHSMQSPSIREKSEKTFLEKYGAKHFAQSETYEKLMLEKYGSLSVGSRRYLYDNIFFDSLWELYFYLFHKDAGDIIIREPTKFTYTYRGITKKYYPDFSVNGKLFEIKSSFFFEDRDDTKKFIDPYGGDQDYADAKWNCMIEHNVEVISLTKIKPYIEYVETKYGKKFAENYYVGRLKTTQDNENTNLLLKEDNAGGK